MTTAEVHQLSTGELLRYDIDAARLPRELAAVVDPLSFDDECRAFVERVAARPHGAARSALYRGLRRLLSDYDAYGLLDMYPMHLLSAAQFERLLGPHPRARLLDAGAGSGAITARAAALFREVWASETSRAMRLRLRRRGFSLVEQDLCHTPPSQDDFDAILCLNVLDRCSRPRTMLSHLVAALARGGSLLISLPLPLRPHVDVGATTVDPDEPLPRTGEGFESAAATIATELLQPAGLRVTRLSRAPYLCRGDSGVRLHVLDAAIFLCERSAAR